MVRLILLLLLFDINKDSTVVDTFDMIEVNHYHNECGVDCWSQLICWDWNSHRKKFEVQHWIMMEDAYKKTEEGEKKWEKLRRSIADKIRDWNQRDFFLSKTAYKGDFVGGKYFPFKNYKSGYYEVRFFDKHLPRRIQAKIYRETHSRQDPEVENRKFFNKDERRGLTVVTKKKKVEVTQEWREFVDRLVPRFHQ